MDDERAMVLRMLKEGKITVEEADALLQELAEQPAEPVGSEPRRSEPTGPEPAPDPRASAASKAETDRGEMPDVREELRTVFRDLIDSVPSDVVRELKEAGEALRPGLFQVVRGLRGLVEGRAEVTVEEGMAAGDEIVLRNAWGDVVLGSAPGDRLRVRALKRVWAPEESAAQREAEALRVDLRRHGRTVEVSVERPLKPHQRARVDFTLAVPPGVNVRLEVAKGDVTADSLRGKMDLRIARGDVKLRDHEGTAALDVISGDIQIGSIRGDVRLDVRSGDVAVRQIEGALRGRVIHGDVTVQDGRALELDVVSGDVTASRLAGAVDVETKSGDVRLGGLHGHDARIRTLAGDVELAFDELVEGTVTVETMSGDIDVRLPSSARAGVDAVTRSGAVRSSLPLAQTTGDRRNLRGMLNGPGATVRLSAMGGDIELREARP